MGRRPPDIGHPWVVRKLRELRQRRVHDAYEAAAHDAEFRRAMGAVAESFDSTIADGLAGSE